MSWFKIFSAVVVGNLVSWILISIIGLFFWIAVMDATTEALFGSSKSQVRVPSPSATISNASPALNQAGEQVVIGTMPGKSVDPSPTQKKRTDPSVIRTNLKMCEFWRAEYRKDGAEQSRKYRDAACTRYRRSLN